MEQGLRGASRTVAHFRRIKIMIAKPIKIPGPDHPITIDANPSRVVVTVGGKVIADTRDALTLREASHPAVQYIPRRDVDMAALVRSDHTTYCPYKGDASYYSIPAGGERSVNAIWTYEQPFEAVAAIRDQDRRERPPSSTSSRSSPRRTTALSPAWRSPGCRRSPG